MPKLIILKDPTGATGKETHKYQPKVTATEMIMEHFPEGIDPDSTTIAINAKEINLNQHPDMSLLTPLKDNDVVTVVNNVQGIGTLLLAAITIASSVYAYTQIPSTPGDVGVSKDSPNNTHSGQTNVIREGQSYPFIFGQPRCYPDLTGEPVTDYQNNVKVVTQFMALGYGTFDLSNTLLAGETDITNFDNAFFEWHEPVNGVTTVESLTTSFTTNEVDGQELPGTNEGGSGAVYPMALATQATSTILAGVLELNVLKDTVTDQLKADFDAATSVFPLEVTYTDRLTPGGGGGTPIFTERKGSGNVASVTPLNTAGEDRYLITIPNFTGLLNGDLVDPVSATQQLGGSVGPISLPAQCEQIWFDIVFLRGLKGTASFQITIQELDGPNGNPIGGIQTDTFSYTADTLDQKFFTYKYDTGSLGYYEFTVERTNNSNIDAANPDQAKLEAVKAIRMFTNRTFGNMTCLTVSVPATENALSLRENKINIRPVSKLITYANGVINYTPQPSRKMADCILHLWVNHFGNDPALLALDELYAIQNNLDAIDPRLATFDFTFDDLDVSLEDRMRAILQVARCTFWNDGGVYRFVRDEAREFHSTTITRMDITHEDDREYSISYNPQLLERYDSVKVQYIESTTNKKDYIFRKVDGAGNIVDGVGNNPMPIDLAGCEESYNAINRAELEIRKLLYQRWTLTDTCHKSAMYLDTGDMVLYAEQYSDKDTFDGEIVAVDGNIATVSERIEWVINDDYIVYYTIDDGSLVGPFPITEVAGNEFQFECASLSQVYLRDGALGFEVQAGSRFIIGTVTNLDAAQWSVIKKEPNGNKVQLTMVNYTDAVYEFDT